MGFRIARIAIPLTLISLATLLPGCEAPPAKVSKKPKSSGKK